MHQSWTGTVAVYLPRLPRIALYVTPASAAAPPADTSAAAHPNAPLPSHNHTAASGGAGIAASGPSAATGPGHGATGKTQGRGYRTLQTVSPCFLPP